MWADAVLVSGMHIQRRQIDDICRRAHSFDRTAVLGGSSVSACPEYYPAFDYLHVGEMGDATDELIARLARDPSRPARQIVLTTRTRRELTDFPLPAYELAQLDRYLTGSIQFSSGCPYECEFCDIPALYGRQPRLKDPAQVTAELDKMLACGVRGAVYFVDDNFIAHRRAVRELLPHLVEWQRRNNFPLALSCEATLNIAKRPEILELMREAMFESVFCGIETPDPDALKAISKDHNMMVPILEAVRTLNSYGLEVVSGIILGLDTDTPRSGRRILDFVEQSRIPMLTINLLQALPRTPLWDRLEREGRLIDEDDRESNVDFRMPYDQVVAMWRECMARAYQPHALFARYEHQVRETYPNRHQAAGVRESLMAERSARPLHVAAHYLGGGSAQRLSSGFLEVRLAVARSRQRRARHSRRSDGASPDRICPRSLGRTAKRLPLLQQGPRASDRRGIVLASLRWRF